MTVERNQPAYRLPIFERNRPVCYAVASKLPLDSTDSHSTIFISMDVATQLEM